MTKKNINNNDYCPSESRIQTLETKMEYKNEKIESLLQDNKQIKADIQALTISVTELTNTLRIREEDSRKLDHVENELIKTQSTVNTLMWIVPVICAIISIIISLYG